LQWFSFVFSLLTYTNYIWYNGLETKGDYPVPLTAKEMVKLFKKHGYEVVKGGGKGSHIKMRKGNHAVTIPNHAELKKGLEKALLKQIKENAL